MTLAANNLAWALATHPESDVRDGAEAVSWGAKACEQTNHAHPDFLDTLACAYAENGEFEKAVETASMAMKIYASKGHTNAAEKMQMRIKLFQRSQPYRDQNL